MDFHVATVDRLLANIDALLYNTTLTHFCTIWTDGCLVDFSIFLFFNEIWMNIFFAMY